MGLTSQSMQVGGNSFYQKSRAMVRGGHSQRPPQPEPIKFLTSPVPSLTIDYNDSDHRSRGPTGHRLILKVVHKILQKPHYNPKRQQKGMPNSQRQVSRDPVCKPFFSFVLYQNRELKKYAISSRTKYTHPNNYFLLQESYVICVHRSTTR